MCLICENENIEILGVKKQQKIYYCNCCHLVFKQDNINRNTNVKNYIMHNFNSHYANYLKLFCREYLFPHMGKKSILDYSNGKFYILKEYFENLNYSYQYNQYRDILNPIYQNYLYDAIILLEVLELSIDPLKELTKIISLLNPNGIILIKTIFKPKKENIMHFWYLNDIKRMTFYDFDVFKYLALKLDLEIIYSNILGIIILKKVN